MKWKQRVNLMWCCISSRSLFMHIYSNHSSWSKAAKWYADAVSHNNCKAIHIYPDQQALDGRWYLQSHTITSLWALILSSTMDQHDTCIITVQILRGEIWILKIFFVDCRIMISTGSADVWSYKHKVSVEIEVCHSHLSYFIHHFSLLQQMHWPQKYWNHFSALVTYG